MMKFITTLLISAGLLFAPALTEAAKTKPAGVVTSVLGKVSYYNLDKSGDQVKTAKSLKVGQPVYPGDRVKTRANGRAIVVLSDGTQLKVSYQTDITLKAKNAKGDFTDRSVSAVKLLVGSLWARVTKRDSKLEFITPAAVAAVKGTTPEFDVDDLGDTCVKLWEGRLDISNDLGGASMAEMQQMCIKKGFKPPQPKTLTGTSGFKKFDETTGGVLTIDGVDADGNPRQVKINLKKK